MPVVGFNFNKISAEKKDLIKKNTQIKINSKLAITNVNKEELPTGKTKAEGLKLDYEFFLDYQPDIAQIQINGFVYYMDDPNIIKDIVKGWEKEKNIPIDVKQQVLNTIILKTTIKALALEQEINIPPHMPFPSVEPLRTKPKKDEYIG